MGQQQFNNPPSTEDSRSCWTQAGCCLPWDVCTERVGAHGTLVGCTDGTHKMSGKGVTNIWGNVNKGTLCFYLQQQGSRLRGGMSYLSCHIAPAFVGVPQPWVSDVGNLWCLQGGGKRLPPWTRPTSCPPVPGDAQNLKKGHSLFGV